jgi:glycosyltransferase involved in cell wall biosynthesis
MKICMVLYDPQEFGGLEEYATTLAVGLQQRGLQTSVLSATWVHPENQYFRRLRDNKIRIVQPPKWISFPASNWETKEKIIASILWVLTPLIYLMAGFLFLQKRRRSWQSALASAQGWLRQKLMWPYIGEDRRQPLTRLLLAWWSFRWRPDIFHIQGYTNTLLFVIDWAHAKGLPVLYEEHQTPDAQFDWWEGFQKSINKSSVVVAVSEKSAQALSTVCGVTKPIIVRNPLLPDPVYPGWQKKTGKPHEEELLFVTTIARLDVAKGLDYLLEAIVLVRQTHPKTQFKVYGDGILREELLDHSSRLGLEGDKIFVGAFSQREQLSRILSQTDIFVLSSILEGQPLGIVEAMAHGCPIIATGVGGIPELIKDGENGLLCKARDPVCLTEKIRILIDNPGLRMKLGNAARRSYEQGPFQPAAVCNHFISIYTTILDQRQIHLPSSS